MVPWMENLGGAAQRTGKSKCVSRNGSFLSVKCHHSFLYGSKPLRRIASASSLRLACASALTLRSDGHVFVLKKSNGVPISSSCPSDFRASVMSMVEPREWPERDAI